MAMRYFLFTKEIVKLFSCSTQLSTKFVLLITLKLLIIANSFLSMKVSLPINMKMLTIVGIFISTGNFITSGLGVNTVIRIVRNS